MPTKGITTPQGLMMLAVAVTLDLAGFFFFFFGTWFGIDDYGILEIIGITIIGLWMFMRYGPLGGDPWKKVKEDRETIKQESQKETPKPTSEKTSIPNKPQTTDIKKWLDPKKLAKDEAKKLAIKALKRFGLNFIIELIPFLGGFWPGWTIIVWKEMKE